MSCLHESRKSILSLIRADWQDILDAETRTVEACAPYHDGVASVLMLRAAEASIAASFFHPAALSNTVTCSAAIVMPSHDLRPSLAVTIQHRRSDSLTGASD